MTAFTDEDLGMGNEWYGDSTKQERLARISKLRKYLSPSIDILTDAHILGFLKANKFHFKNSRDSIQNHLEFRRTRKVDDPSFDHFNAGRSSLKSNYLRIGGLDKNLRPILVFQAGNIPTEALSLECDDHAAIHIAKNIIHPLHAILQQDKITFITDIQDFNPVSQFHKSFIQNFVERSISQFPESMAKSFIVNYSTTAYVAWMFVKKVLEEKTLSTTSFAEKEELLEVVNVEMLEKKWGGRHEEFPRSDDLRCDFRWYVKEMAKIDPENAKVITAMKVIETLQKPDDSIYFDCEEIREKVRMLNEMA